MTLRTSQESSVQRVCGVMASMFQYLFRFTDESGEINYGNLTEEVSPQDLPGRTVSVLAGNPLQGLQLTGHQRTVVKVRCHPMHS
jgi:hypothetical protein